MSLRQCSYLDRWAVIFLSEDANDVYYMRLTKLAVVVELQSLLEEFKICSASGPPVCKKTHTSSISLCQSNIT